MFKIEDIKNKIICGDNLDIAKDIPSNSISACLTDPPYGLGFMGKEWDTFKDGYITAIPACPSVSSRSRSRARCFGN